MDSYASQVMMSTYLTNLMLGEMSDPNHPNNFLFKKIVENFLSEKRDLEPGNPTGKKTYGEWGCTYAHLKPFNQAHYAGMLYVFAVGLKETLDEADFKKLCDNFDYNKFIVIEGAKFTGTEARANHPFTRLRNAISHFHVELGNSDQENNYFIFEDFNPLKNPSDPKFNYVKFKLNLKDAPILNKSLCVKGKRN